MGEEGAPQVLRTVQPGGGRLQKRKSFTEVGREKEQTLSSEAMGLSQTRRGGNTDETREEARGTSARKPAENRLVDEGKTPVGDLILG